MILFEASAWLGGQDFNIPLDLGGARRGGAGGGQQKQGASRQGTAKKRGWGAAITHHAGSLVHVVGTKQRQAPCQRRRTFE